MILDTILFLGYEALSGFVPFLVIFLIARTIQTRKGIPVSHRHFFAVLVFSFYVIGVYHVTGVGTIYDGFMYGLELRQDQINWIPFSQDINVTGYLLNIILFIPLGLLAPLIWTKMNKLHNVIGAGFFFTVLIEASQLLNHRATDIDDILLNLLGAAVGFALFKGWDRVTKSRFRIDSSAVWELPVCIIAVFLGRFFLYHGMGLARFRYGF